MLVITGLIKRRILLLGLVICPWFVVAQNAGYIANHKVIAMVLSEHYGIPAPVILAVATVESSGGAAPVAKVLNNHFGVVGKNEFVNRKGRTSRYKQYGNELASYIDFCRIISHKRFYRKLKGNNDCKAWVRAISHSGYSEVPEEWEKKVFGVLATSKHEYAQDLASK